MTEIEGTSIGLNFIHEIKTHRAASGPHTLSILPTNSAEPGRYKAIIGPMTDSVFDIWIADNPHTWRLHPQRRELTMPYKRWPSLVQHEECEFMVVRTAINHTCPSEIRPHIVCSSPLYAFDRIYRYGTQRHPTAIELYKNEDGTSYEKVGDLVTPTTSGHRFNQNPFLAKTSLGYVLLWYSGENGSYNIQYRIADNPIGLLSAPSRPLVNSKRVLAAPSIYEDKSGHFHLFTEELKGGVWITTYRTTRSLNGFSEASRELIFEKDQACATPFIMDGGLFIWVSKRTQTGLIEKWVGEIYSIEL